MIDANQFAFFPQFAMAVYKALQQGITVTEFSHGTRRSDRVLLVLEVRVKKLNGTTMPRVTEAMKNKAERRAPSKRI